MIRRLLLVLVVSMVCIGDASVPRALGAPFAQEDQRCFPETGQCISGRFRQYWEQNGGLAVFGFPLSSVMGQEADDGTFETQWFERNSFELHPENESPYDVLLGRLGDDRLKQLARVWQAEPKGSQQPECAWFVETAHSVCEPFRSYWQNHGLQDPALNAYGKSLALFGSPLTEATVETNSSGATVVMQWFERARFECHPNNPPEYQVLLGLLGKEVNDNPGIPAAGAAVPCTVTVAQPTPQPTPEPQPPAPPAFPTPRGVYAQNAPAPAEGAQAWMTVTNPNQRSATTLCVRLIVNGQPVQGALASGVAHFKSTNTPLVTLPTGADGVAGITFSIGGATAGYTVDVDAYVSHEGTTYEASTSFTPR